jgi:hypothetical protein
MVNKYFCIWLETTNNPSQLKISDFLIKCSKFNSIKRSIDAELYGLSGTAIGNDGGSFGY